MMQIKTQYFLLLLIARRIASHFKLHFGKTIVRQSRCSSGCLHGFVCTKPGITGLCFQPAPEHFWNKQNNSWLQPLLRNICEWHCKCQKAVYKACCFCGGRPSSEQFWHSDLQQTFGILSLLGMNKLLSPIWIKLLFHYLLPLSPLHVMFPLRVKSDYTKEQEFLSAIVALASTLFL